MAASLRRCATACCPPAPPEGRIAPQTAQRGSCTLHYKGATPSSSARSSPTPTLRSSSTRLQAAALPLFPQHPLVMRNAHQPRRARTLACQPHTSATTRASHPHALPIPNSSTFFKRTFHTNLLFMILAARDARIPRRTHDGGEVPGEPNPHAALFFQSRATLPAHRLASPRQRLDRIIDIIY